MPELMREEIWKLPGKLASWSLGERRPYDCPRVSSFNYRKKLVKLRDLMAQRLPRWAVDREVPGSSPTQD